MLLSKEVEMVWRPNNKRRFEENGYVFTKYGDKFLVNLEHVKNGSEKKVLVRCDYCEREYLKEYGDHNKSQGKDCCSFCCGKKRKENDKEFNRKYFSKALEYDEVVKRFVEASHTPLFSKEDYKKNNIKLKCLCNVTGEEVFVSLVSLCENNHCWVCANIGRREKHKTPSSVVLDCFTEKGLILLDIEKYQNKDTKLEYVCEIHQKQIQKTTLSGLRRTSVPCKFCRFENMVTELSRMIRSRLWQWKAEILLKYNNKCVISGSANCDVHHTYPLNQMIRDELKIERVSLDSIKKDPIKSMEFIEKIVAKHDENNGILLSTPLHNKFHSIYGKSPTLENLEEFIKLEKE